MSDPHGIIGIYRKGGSMSFLENENQMVIDAIYHEIGEQLVEDWVNSNLDEGQMNTINGYSQEMKTMYYYLF